MDLETVNRRLRDQQFIKSPADREFYRVLNAKIERLRRPGDDFEPLSENAADAWNHSYQEYERRLKREQATLPDPQIAAKAARWNGTERRWAEYLEYRGQILELVRREEIGEETAKYLGLRPGDLEPIKVEPDGRRPANWEAKVDRLGEALGRWQQMSAHEKHSIPSEMRARRAEERLAALERVGPGPLSKLLNNQTMELENGK